MKLKKILIIISILLFVLTFSLRANASQTLTKIVGNMSKPLVKSMGLSPEVASALEKVVAERILVPSFTATFLTKASRIYVNDGGDIINKGDLTVPASFLNDGLKTFNVGHNIKWGEATGSYLLPINEGVVTYSQIATMLQDGLVKTVGDMEKKDLNISRATLYAYLLNHLIAPAYWFAFSKDAPNNSPDQLDVLLVMAKLFENVTNPDAYEVGPPQNLIKNLNRELATLVRERFTPKADVRLSPEVSIVIMAISKATESFWEAIFYTYKQLTVPGKSNGFNLGKLKAILQLFSKTSHRIGSFSDALLAAIQDKPIAFLAGNASIFNILENDFTSVTRQFPMVDNVSDLITKMPTRLFTPIEDFRFWRHKRGINRGIKNAHKGAIVRLTFNDGGFQEGWLGDGGMSGDYISKNSNYVIVTTFDGLVQRFHKRLIKKTESRVVPTWVKPGSIIEIRRSDGDNVRSKGIVIANSSHSDAMWVKYLKEDKKTATFEMRDRIIEVFYKDKLDLASARLLMEPIDYDAKFFIPTPFGLKEATVMKTATGAPEIDIIQLTYGDGEIYVITPEDLIRLNANYTKQFDNKMPSTVQDFSFVVPQNSPAFAAYRGTIFDAGAQNTAMSESLDSGSQISKEFSARHWANVMIYSQLNQIGFLEAVKLDGKLPGTQTIVEDETIDVEIMRLFYSILQVWHEVEAKFNSMYLGNYEYYYRTMMDSKPEDGYTIETIEELVQALGRSKADIQNMLSAWQSAQIKLKSDRDGRPIKPKTAPDIIIQINAILKAAEEAELKPYFPGDQVFKPLPDEVPEVKTDRPISGIMETNG